MTNLLERAVLLANRGYYIFPLSPNSKFPIADLKWRDESTVRISTIEKWWKEKPNYNIGIDTGKSGIYVIDVDIKKGKEGAKSFDALDLMYDFPNTIVSITPTGGRHHIYKSPMQPLGNTVETLGKGLDTRGWGGYIVAPGSIIDGKEYYFTPDSPMTPADFPEWIGEKLKEHRIASKQNNRNDKLSEDREDDIARAKEWLINVAEYAVEGSGGDHHTFSVAAKLREFGLSADTVLDLMLDNWNEECSPPWNPEDLKRKVDNAFSYSQKAQGSASPHAEFQAVIEPVDYNSFAPAFHIPDTIPKREWIFDDIALAKKLTMLVAPPGVGKSTLTIGIAASKASGKPILGFNPRGAGNVLLINNEDDMEELQRRTKALCQHFAITDADFIENDAMGAAARSRLMIQSGENRPLKIAQRTGAGIKAKDVEALVDTILKFNIKLLIVDPFSETHPANENDNGEMLEVAKLYREVAQRGNCSVILVHHDRKPDKADSEGHVGNMHSARGASSIAGVARIMFTFHNMSLKDCKKYGIADEQRNLYVRLDNAKANMTLAGGEPRWFKRIGEILGGTPDDPDSGESVGILAPTKLIPKKAVEGTASYDLINDIEAVIKDEGDKGMAVTTIAGELVNAFSSHTGKRKDALAKAIQRMFIEGEPLPSSKGFIHLVEHPKQAGAAVNAPRFFIRWSEKTAKLDKSSLY